MQPDVHERVVAAGEEVMVLARPRVDIPAGGGIIVARGGTV
ncbi:MAG: hypothetical protein WBD63_02265 [Phycisphaerae bacterium]